jgi:hypothetical protein
MFNGQQIPPIGRIIDIVKGQRACMESESTSPNIGLHNIMVLLISLSDVSVNDLRS